MTDRVEAPRPERLFVPLRGTSDQRRQVDKLLAAEETASERRTLADAADAAKRDFWTRRFATLNR